MVYRKFDTALRNDQIHYQYTKKGQKLAELAKEFGISKQRVSQIVMQVSCANIIKRKRRKS